MAKGANLNAEVNGYTAHEANWYCFDLFERKGDTRNAACYKLAKVLIELGLKQDLMTAIMFGDKDAIVTFQSKDVELRSREMEDIAIGHCIKERRPEILRLVLELSVEPPSTGPLGWAAAMGQDDMVKMLLSHGADVNENDRFNGTPLHRAVRANQPATIEVLLQHGANPNARDRKGMTPIQVCTDLKTRNEIHDIFDGQAKGDRNQK